MQITFSKMYEGGDRDKKLCNAFLTGFGFCRKSRNHTSKIHETILGDRFTANKNNRTMIAITDNKSYEMKEI
jgi:hypothetical protein